MGQQRAEYQVKLASGRILGPLNLSLIHDLISNHEITDSDLIKKDTDNNWVSILSIPEVALFFSPDLKSENSSEKTQFLEPTIGETAEETKTFLKSLEVETRTNLTESPTQILVRQEIAEAKTVFYEKLLLKKSHFSKKKFFLYFLVIGGVCYSFYDKPRAPLEALVAIRPMLPHFSQKSADPKKSHQIYIQSMKDYLQDTVLGYENAIRGFNQSVFYDPENVKAIAMLASSYLNLIDSSNKDEVYFNVISRLLDMARAKSVDLAETVISDIEFYLIINKFETAYSRIIGYTNTHENYGLEMFYYLSLVFFHKGDFASAVKYLSQFPEEKIYSAKIFYLRAQIAEKLKDIESAKKEYGKAIKFNPQHAKSYLRLSSLLHQEGKPSSSLGYLEFLLSHKNLLSPFDLAEAYYLRSQIYEIEEKWILALKDIEHAVQLNADNHDYLLELYTLQAHVLELPFDQVTLEEKNKIKKVQDLAKMYFFLGEGEKLIKEGKYHDAIVPFLQARQANDRDSLPLVKMGDMFSYLQDIENAKVNYKLAIDRDPNNIKIWSKYIDTLIQSYEWQDAQKAMDRFRHLPIQQGFLDKAAADMYQKQGRYLEAQALYRKALKRETIDPSVYIAYAKSLIKTKNFKEAPFFLSLARRFDPLNVDAVIHHAKCISETDSIDAGIDLLQDELQKSNTTRAEFLAAIGELQIQKGSWDQAQRTIDQAMKANSDYAFSWKLQAQIYMNRENTEKNALDQALLAYKKYSDRNASDPSGYLERYKIYLKKSDFESAKNELSQIFQIYPKYPNLHYYLGALYALQSNHKVAAEEFKLELANHPMSVQALIAYGKEVLETGRAQEALDHFSKAMLLDSKSVDARQNAGWANFHLKNYDSAITLMRVAIEMDRGNPLLHKRLGAIYQELGDQATACLSFKKYLEMEPDASDKAQFASCF